MSGKEVPSWLDVPSPGQAPGAPVGDSGSDAGYEAAKSPHFDGGDYEGDISAHMEIPQQEVQSKKKSGCAINLALSVVLIPAAFLLFKYLNSIVQFIVDHVYWMLVGGFITKLVSKIIFALAFVPIGTLYKLVHALLPGEGDCIQDHVGAHNNLTLADTATTGGEEGCDGDELANACFISPAYAALLYSVLSAIIESVAFVFHREYTQMNDDGEEAAGIIGNLRDGLSKIIDLQSGMTPQKKFLVLWGPPRNLHRHCNRVSVWHLYSLGRIVVCAGNFLRSKCFRRARHWDIDLLRLRHGLLRCNFRVGDDIVVPDHR